MHVARNAGDVQRLADIVALHDRDHVGRPVALVHQAADAQGRLQAERDLGQHVGQLQLIKLLGGERHAELLPVEPVLLRGVHAELGCTHRAPADPVAGAVEAGKRAFEALHFGEHGGRGHAHLVHHDHAGGAGAQRKLAFDLGRREAFHALFEHEATNGAAVFLALGPDHEDVGEGRVGNPRLAAGDDVIVAILLGVGLHPRRIGARIGFGQTEAADQLARGETGQVLLLLLFAAEGLYRVHHQARLNAGHRTVAAIDPLDLARDEAVGDIAGADAAIFFRHGNAQHPGLPHQREEFGRARLFTERVDHAWLELALREGVRGLADHPLVLGQLVVEAERIGGIEGDHGWRARLFRCPCPWQVGGYSGKPR